jgi:hypothetical protein
VAEETVSPEDMKEDLIHSLQKYVEVDEPEAECGSDGSQCLAAERRHQVNTVDDNPPWNSTACRKKIFCAAWKASSRPSGPTTSDRFRRQPLAMSLSPGPAPGRSGLSAFYPAFRQRCWPGLHEASRHDASIRAG